MRFDLVLIPALIVLIISGSLNAKTSDGTPTDPLFSMPLQDLLLVSVASTETERLINAPGIVSRYEMRDMENLGLHTLIDVLTFIPGVSVQRAINGNYSIHMRGLMDLTNQKVLFLLDETPVWSPSHADNPLLGIPSELISHVEVIRGPGSVIYGSNASAGVIKVVTRKDANDSLALTTGSHGLKGFSTYQYWQQDKWQLHFGAERKGSRGYPARIEKALEFNGMGFDPIGEGSFRFAEDIKSAFLDVAHDQTSLTLHAFESRTDASAFGSLNDQSTFVQRSFLLALKHDWVLRDWSLSAFSEYNQYDRFTEIDNVLAVLNVQSSAGRFRSDNGGRDNFRWRNGFHASYPVQQDLQLLAGIEYEDRSTEDYRLSDDVGGADIGLFVGGLPPDQTNIKIFPKNSAYELSQFAQLDYQLGKWRWIGGLRYSHNQKYGAKTTPRLSALYSLSDTQSLKFLYSQGFSTPVFSQDRDVDSQGNPIDPDIKAEEISTTEVAYSFEDSMYFFVANAFYTEVRNLLGLETTGNGVPANASSTIYRSGIETDLQYHNGPWKTYLNTAWLSQGGTENMLKQSAYISPRLSTNAGLRYALNARHALGISHQWKGNRAGYNPAWSLNASYEYQHDDNEVFISLRNLTDRRNLEPDGRYSAENSIQNIDRFNILFGFRHQF
ncbi:MAG: hypothetical protein C9356_09590 [Oleiphilus sp.]|nr:MAG: hypothetical protein C9356_09590 [Oleiphilus sp.]